LALIDTTDKTKRVMYDINTV